MWNNTSNCSEACEYRGGQYVLKWPLPQHIQALVAVQSIIALVGLLSNGSFIYVITKNKKLQTTMNYYLLNLGVADVFFLMIYTPILVSYTFSEQAYRSSFGLGLCITQVFFPVCPLYVMMFTISFISIERYFKICKSGKKTHPLQRTWLVSLIMIWAIAATLSVIWGILQCHHSGEGVDKVAGLVMFTVPFCLTAIVVTAVYTSIMHFLTRCRCSVSSGVSIHSVRRNKQVVKMLIVTTGVLGFCLIPFNINNVMLITMDGKGLEQTEPLTNFYYTVATISELLLYVNAAINPLVYAIASADYRNAYRVTFNWKGRTAEPVPRSDNHTMVSKSKNEHFV